jgi:hypothetical protein
MTWWMRQHAREVLPYLTTKDIAKECGVSTDVVRYWIASKKLPASKPISLNPREKWRINPSDWYTVRDSLCANHRFFWILKRIPWGRVLGPLALIGLALTYLPAILVPSIVDKPGSWADVAMEIGLWILVFSIVALAGLALSFLVPALLSRAAE